MSQFQTIQSLATGEAGPFRRRSGHVSALAARFCPRPAAPAPAQVGAAPARLAAALARLRALLLACACYSLAVLALTLVLGDALRGLEG